MRVEANAKASAKKIEQQRNLDVQQAGEAGAEAEENIPAGAPQDVRVGDERHEISDASAGRSESGDQDEADPRLGEEGEELSGETAWGRKERWGGLSRNGRLRGPEEAAI